MKVLWTLEPSPSMYHGLRGVRRLLPDGVSQERMILLQDRSSPTGTASTAAAATIWGSFSVFDRPKCRLGGRAMRTWPETPLRPSVEGRL